MNGVILGLDKSKFLDTLPNASVSNNFNITPTLFDYRRFEPMQDGQVSLAGKITEVRHYTIKYYIQVIMHMHVTHLHLRVCIYAIHLYSFASNCMNAYASTCMNAYASYASMHTYAHAYMCTPVRMSMCPSVRMHM